MGGNGAGQSEEKIKQEVGLTDQDKNIQELFKSKVTSYLSGNGTSQEAINAAKSFVDQTFTAPAEEQLRMANSDFEQAAAARNAALGRGGTDSSFQELLYGNMANQRANLGAQRGAMIAQEAINSPLRQLQVGADGINAIGATQQQRAFAPSFLNALNQQAFQNRNALLNNLTSQRMAAPTQTTTQSTDTGLLGAIGTGLQVGTGIAGLLSGNPFAAAGAAGGLASAAAPALNANIGVGKLAGGNPMMYNPGGLLDPTRFK